MAERREPEIVKYWASSSPIEIPKSLAEKLDRLGPRFCLVKNQDKDPSIGGKGWQLPENLMYSTDPKLQNHLKSGGNYGVCGGNHLTIIDADAEEVKQAISQGLPDTFTVRSPGSGGYHFYFLCADLSKKYVLIDRDKNNTGHVQGEGKMVVGPSCIHPNGGTYQIVKDLPFARITDQQLREVLKEFIRETEKAEEAARREKSESNIELDICQVVPLSDLKKRGDEYQGPHPLHGSTQGKPRDQCRNFNVNPIKNVWHCWAHDSGGGPLEWLAVEEGIIDCSDAGHGSLRGDKFKKVLEKARERGLIKEQNKNKFFSPPPQGGYISEPEPEEEINPKALEPMTLNEVEQTLDSTLKRDHENKLLVFLGMLMNYSGDDQQNILFNAPSSTGKSYIALEIARLFPLEDVDKKGYTSPTSFFHVMGKLCTLDEQPLLDRNAYVESKLDEWEQSHPRPEAPGYNDKSPEAVSARKDLAEWKQQRKSMYRRYREEWDNIEKIYVVSLEKRILIFKDQPHDRVLQVLRSMLSHDEKVLEVDITDKTKEGGHRTKKIRVLGFPTVVFCSAEFSLNEQERTRFWMLSPDMSQEKFRESLNLQAKRLSNKSSFESQLEADEKRLLLMDRIRAIRNAEVNEVIIPKPLADRLLLEFAGGRDLAPRDLRDFPRLLDLVKAHTLFQMFQRARNGNAVVANEEDVKTAQKLLNGVIDANRLGLPPYVYKFFDECLKSSIPETGISREDFSRLYFNFYKERLGEGSRKRLLDLLSEAGLVEEQPDPLDKRKNRIYIRSEGVEKIKKIISEIEGVEEVKKAYTGLACDYCKKEKITIRYEVSWIDREKKSWFVCQDCGDYLIREKREEQEKQ